MNDLFGDVPVTSKTDALGFLIRWARHHGRKPFSPEDAISAASAAGIEFAEKRAWGAVFKQAAKEGYIRRAGLFARASSNHSIRPGWCAA